MASFFEDDDEKKAREYAQLAPAQQIGFRQRQHELGTGRAAEDLMRQGLGVGPSPQRHREEAGLALRDLAARLRPGTEEFYAEASDVLRKHGLVEESEAMEAKRLGLETGKAEANPTLKLQRTKDLLLKRQAAGDKSVDIAIASIDDQLALLGKSQGEKAADPEFLRYLNEYEKAMKEGNGDRAAQIKSAMDAWIANKQKAGAEMTAYQQIMAALRQREVVRHEKKDDAKMKADEDAAIGSLQALTRSVDAQIQTAEALVEHPGLPWITGARLGTGIGSIATSVMKEAAADAQAFMDTLQAQVFMQALNDARSTSKNSTTGLGQLTEREGDKIQSARASVRPQQATSQFKVVLREYIRVLKEARKNFADALTSRKATVPASPPPLAVGREPISKIAPSAQPTPTPSPAPAPAATEKPKRKFKATKID